MGYRHKIAVISKEKYFQIKDMTLPELKELRAKESGAEIDGDGYTHLSCYHLSTELYELGKYCDMEYLEKYSTRIFSDDEANDHFNDECVFIIIGKDGLTAIIAAYHEKILTYFQGLRPQNVISDIDKLKGIKSIESHIQNKVKEWGEDCEKFKVFPYNLSLKSDEVVSSWKYEYAIFELIRIYKSINWDNQIVTLNAW